MAAFRYRVTAASGLIGGFRDKEDAELFAKMKSAMPGASVMMVFDKPHASEAAPIAAYLRGDRQSLLLPYPPGGGS